MQSRKVELNDIQIFPLLNFVVLMLGMPNKLDVSKKIDVGCGVMRGQQFSPEI
jgi:hypothetical protein